MLQAKPHSCARGGEEVSLVKYIMWKKIENIEDFKKMKEQAALLKYSNIGVPEESVNENDAYKINKYLISKIILEEPQIDLVDFELQGKTFETSHRKINSGVLHKTFNEMINERIWWYNFESD